MSFLRYGGYFHLEDGRPRVHPVDSLEQALDTCCLEDLFSQSILVLPEAFNIIGDYFGAEAGSPDTDVKARLTNVSRNRRLCFVVGLVRVGAERYSEAVLIDGGDIVETLSRKRLEDGSPCYEPDNKPAEDKIILHRNLRIGGLVCLDATGWGDREKQQHRHCKIVEEFGQYTEAGLLCIPGRFAGPQTIEVAKDWNRRSISVVIGNCGLAASHPSVLHFSNGQSSCSPPDGKCHVHLAPWPLPRARRRP